MEMNGGQKLTFYGATGTLVETYNHLSSKSHGAIANMKDIKKAEVKAQKAEKQKPKMPKIQKKKSSNHSMDIDKPQQTSPGSSQTKAPPPPLLHLPLL